MLTSMKVLDDSLVRWFQISLYIWIFWGLNMFQFYLCHMASCDWRKGTACIRWTKAPGTNIHKWVRILGISLGSAIITSWVLFLFYNKRGSCFLFSLSENYGLGSQFTRWELRSWKGLWKSCSCPSYLRFTEKWILIFTVDRWMPELELDRKLVQDSVHKPPTLAFVYFLL